MLTFYLANPVPTLMTVLFLTLILVCTSQEECVHVLLFIGEFFFFGMKIRVFHHLFKQSQTEPEVLFVCTLET